MKPYAIPGVFMEEISRPPFAVAEIATAIPAFIGYTQITNKDAAGIHPVRISSLSEYETIFGKADKTVMIDVSINDEMEDDVLKDRIVYTTAYGSTPNTMYYHMQLYFANGGGPCYIVSVGKANKTLCKNDLLAGLEVIGRFNEPTLLVFPEGVNLPVVNTPEVLAAQAAVETATETGIQEKMTQAYADLAAANTKSKAASLHEVYNEALLQCATLKNRFVIMDCMNDDPEVLRNAAYGIGHNNLAYGAAYHPFLQTQINYVYDDASFTVWHVINGDISTYFTGGLSYDPELHEELLQVARQKAAGVCIKLNPCSVIAAIYASAHCTGSIRKIPIRLNLVKAVTISIPDEDPEMLNKNSTADNDWRFLRRVSA